MRRITAAAGAFVVSFVSATGSAVELPFSAASIVEGGYAEAISVATGDIDGDGVLDVVAASYADTTPFYWWRGAGDGTFTRLTVAGSTSKITDVEIVDVDGDGDADLLVCTDNTGVLLGWFENDGNPVDGGWIPRVVASGFAQVTSEAAGDLDGDGDVDGVIASPDAGAIAAALNNGESAPSYETVDDAFPGAWGVTVGDIDGDGDQDVAAVSIGSEPAGGPAWWSREGVDSWTRHDIAVLAGAACIVLADMDGDGDLDALVSSIDNTTIRWYENNGVGGGWSAHAVGTAVEWVASLLADDLDHDGDLDVLFGHASGDIVAWWENNDGDGSTWTGRLVDGTFDDPVGVAAGDADGDGDTDLFAVSYDSGDIAMWENLTIHRSALYPEGQNAGAVDWVEDLQLVDVDGDGDLDLVAGDTETEELVWSENDLGDGSSWTAHVIESEVLVEALSAGDFNRDGLLDIARCTSTGISWWASDGVGGWTEHVVPSTEIGCRALAAADFDRDGDLDLIKGSNTTAFDWYENTDGVGGTWSESSAGSGWTSQADAMTVADVDGDGDVDVVAATYDRVSWYANDLAGSGFIGGAHVVFDQIGAAARSVAVGDIDGDGDPDVASELGTDDVVVWFENTAGDGSTWSAAQTIDPSIDGVRAVALADLDLDGDLDVIATAESAGSACELVWYENSVGDGSAWTDHLISTETTRASIVAAGDIDRDGDPDVVVDSVQGNARWWPNEGGQFALSTTPTAPLTLDEGELDDVLKVVVTHRGKSADADLEPATLTIGFAGADGLPLTQGEMDTLFQGIYIFEDDNDSGDFEPAFDSEVARMVPPVVSDGDVVLVLPDGDSHLRVTPSTERVLFVAVTLEWGAAAASENQFQVVNWAGKATAEDWNHDTPLLIEHAVDVSSGLVTSSPGPSEIFSDDFESGDHLAWSAAVGG